MAAKIGCRECENGKKFFYFENTEARTVRTDFILCPSCYPDATESLKVYPDEEAIGQDAFYVRLNDLNWGLADVV